MRDQIISSMISKELISKFIIHYFEKENVNSCFKDKIQLINIKFCKNLINNCTIG